MYLSTAPKQFEGRLKTNLDPPPSHQCIIASQIRSCEPLPEVGVAAFLAQPGIEAVGLANTATANITPQFRGVSVIILTELGIGIHQLPLEYIISDVVKIIK